MYTARTRGVGPPYAAEYIGRRILYVALVKHDSVEEAVEDEIVSLLMEAKADVVAARPSAAEKGDECQAVREALDALAKSLVGVSQGTNTDQSEVEDDEGDED